MAGSPAEGTRLAEPDWEQGSLLPADAGALPLQWVHPSNPELKAGKSAMKVADLGGQPLTTPFPVAVPAKQGDRMMVITQTCDIIKTPREMPQVEVARVRTTRNERMIAHAQDFGSARYFRINAFHEPEALILDYGHRALLDKGFVGAVAPDNALVGGTGTSPSANGWRAGSVSATADRRSPMRITSRSPAPFATSGGSWSRRTRRGPPSTTAPSANGATDGRTTGRSRSTCSRPIPSPTLCWRSRSATLLADAISTVFAGPVNVATDRRSYHTFTKADELSTEQIGMKWASRDEDGGDAASRPERPLRRRRR